MHFESLNWNLIKIGLRQGPFLRIRKSLKSHINLKLSTCGTNRLDKDKTLSSKCYSQTLKHQGMNTRLAVLKDTTWWLDCQSKSAWTQYEGYNLMIFCRAVALNAYGCHKMASKCKHTQLHVIYVALLQSTQPTHACIQTLIQVDTSICTLILHFLSKINDSISTQSHSHMNSQTDGTANSSNLGFNILTRVWVKAAILYIYFHLYCFYDSLDCLNCFYWIINLKLVELKQLPSASESFNFNSRFYTTIFWPCRSIL